MMVLAMAPTPYPACRRSGTEKIELFVVADPHPTTRAVLGTERTGRIAADLPHPVGDAHINGSPRPTADR